MENSRRYNTYDNNIISDVFGEEVDLVNLETGDNYSLSNSASQIWIRLINQYSPTEIFADLIQIYQVDENDLISDINRFISQLLEAKMIKNESVAVKKPIDFNLTGILVNYTSPVVEAFSDMQEILLLDPVHDVDKAGWPISKNSDTPS